MINKIFKVEIREMIGHNNKLGIIVIIIIIATIKGHIPKLIFILITIKIIEVIFLIPIITIIITKNIVVTQIKKKIIFIIENFLIFKKDNKDLLQIPI